MSVKTIDTSIGGCLALHVFHELKTLQERSLGDPPWNPPTLWDITPKAVLALPEDIYNHPMLKGWIVVAMFKGHNGPWEVKPNALAIQIRSAFEKNPALGFTRDETGNVWVYQKEAQ